MDTPELSAYMTEGFNHAETGDFGWLVENSDEWTPAYNGDERAIIFRKGVELIRVTIVGVFGEPDERGEVDALMAGEGRIADTVEDARMVVNEARMDYLLRRYEAEGRFNEASMN